MISVCFIKYRLVRAQAIEGCERNPRRATRDLVPEDSFLVYTKGAKLFYCSASISVIKEKMEV